MIPVVVAPFPKGAPLGQAFEICTLWDKNLQMVADPEQGGRLQACLVGRMILFSQKTTAVCCDGTLKVMLFDESPDSATPHRILEHWEIDKYTLRRMINKDSLGFWGYTLPMPTVSCTPNVTRVSLQVAFQPENSNPLYAHTDPMTLRSIQNSSQRQYIQQPIVNRAGGQQGPGGAQPAMQQVQYQVIPVNGPMQPLNMTGQIRQ